MSNSSIWPIDKTLSDAATPGQSRHRSNGNEGVLSIPQIASITGASLSDFFCHTQYSRWRGGGGSYTSEEMQTMYSTAPADWACYNKRTRDQPLPYDVKTGTLEKQWSLEDIQKQSPAISSPKAIAS